MTKIFLVIALTALKKYGIDNKYSHLDSTNVLEKLRSHGKRQYQSGFCCHNGSGENAELAVFLSSPKAANITGSVINIDGGLTV